jgi:hypothetical protein
LIFLFHKKISDAENRFKRQEVRKPMELFVETALVIDVSVFEQHKRFIKDGSTSNDNELIYEEM